MQKSFIIFMALFTLVACAGQTSQTKNSSNTKTGDIHKTFASLVTANCLRNDVSATEQYCDCYGTEMAKKISVDEMTKYVALKKYTTGLNTDVQGFSTELAADIKKTCQVKNVSNKISGLLEIFN